MSDDVELLFIETFGGPGNHHLVETPDGERIGVGGIRIGGQYVGLQGDFEMECADWEISDDRLRITP